MGPEAVPERPAWQAPSDTAPACREHYPYALRPMPMHPDLFFVFQPYRSFGTPSLVRALVEASGQVAKQFPDADPIFIGDLSTYRGGALPPHRWHHDGRSADIGLFAHQGRQPQHGFEPVWSPQLDVEKTWALIDALLATGKVEHILLDHAHIRRIKAYLVEQDLLSPDELLRIFPVGRSPAIWRQRGIVRHAPRHGDHMHVRVTCE